MSTFRELLAMSARQFRFYEKQHRAKGTLEADSKAEVNAKIAEEIEAALNECSKGEAAVTIGEHAFRHGYRDAVRNHGSNVSGKDAALKEQEAWDEYDPPEDIKELTWTPSTEKVERVFRDAFELGVGWSQGPYGHGLNVDQAWVKYELKDL